MYIFSRIGFQSTHPRGVRPEAGLAADAHASFNPRTRVGCDAHAYPPISSPACFNPRTRVGCDRIMTCFDSPGFMFQSTHPRGVRLNHDIHFANVTVFQSTHPRGVRHVGLKRIYDRVMFQSTHPRGVRPRRTSCSIKRPSFNPRTRVGCDVKLRIVGVVIAVSIHAPAWGATDESLKIYDAREVSIHAPAWGATRPKRGDRG